MVNRTAVNPGSRTEFPDDTRINCALNAAAEIESLSNSLLEQIAAVDGVSGPMLKLITKRTRDLSRAIFGALDDRVMETKELELIVRNDDEADNG